MKYTVTCGGDFVSPIELLTTESKQEALDTCCEHCKITDEEGNVVWESRWEDEVLLEWDPDIKCSCGADDCPDKVEE